MNFRILSLSIYLILSLSINKDLIRDTSVNNVEIFQESNYATIINRDDNQTEFKDCKKLYVTDKFMIFTKDGDSYYKSEIGNTNEIRLNNLKNIFILKEFLVLVESDKSIFLKNDSDKISSGNSLKLEVTSIEEFSDYYIINDVYVYKKKDLVKKNLNEDKTVKKIKIIREHLLVEFNNSDYYLYDKFLNPITDTNLDLNTIVDSYNGLFLVCNEKFQYSIYKYEEKKTEPKLKTTSESTLESEPKEFVLKNEFDDKLKNSNFRFMEYNNKIVLFNNYLNTDDYELTQIFKDLKDTDLESISIFNKFLIYKKTTTYNNTKKFYYNPETKAEYSDYTNIFYTKYINKLRTYESILFILEDKKINKYHLTGDKVEYVDIRDFSLVRIIAANYYLGVFSKKTVGEEETSIITKNMNLFTYDKGIKQVANQEVPNFVINGEDKDKDINPNPYKKMLVFKKFVVYDGVQLYNGLDFEYKDKKLIIKNTEYERISGGANLQKKILNKLEKEKTNLQTELTKEKENSTGLQTELTTEKEKSTGIKELLKKEEEKSKGLKENIATKKKEIIKSNEKLTKITDEKKEADTNLEKEKENSISLKRNYDICLGFSIVLGILFLLCLGFIIMQMKKSKSNNDIEENLIDQE